MASVLVVEDDQFVRSALIRHLTDASHTVRSVGTALEALREVAHFRFDVVILDLGLPDLDGSEALKMLRGITDVPVIVATARDDEAEVVRLLNAGADDYLTKPFSVEHLSARMAAVLRRARTGPAEAAPSTVIRVGGLTVDPLRRQAELDGARLDLTRREFDLLAFLAGRPGVVVPRKELLAEVWQQSYGDDQTIDVHLSWLRRKLGETARPAALPAHPARCRREAGAAHGAVRRAGRGASRSGATAMRWALVKVSLAVTAMVVVAFAVPLGLVIREMARDRAFSNAEREAAAVAPALSITTEREQLERVVASAGSDAGMAVHIPASGQENGGTDIGRQRATDEDIAAVREMGRASTTEVTGGSTLLQPVALSSGEIAVVEVYVPESEVTNGVGTAWAVLAAVGAALIVGSVAVADRLGIRMVQPAQRLVEGAHELGEGKLGARVPEEDRTNCASRRSRSTPWPTRSSSCWPTNGSWPPTCPTGCVPR